ncbi:uncharacterized protein LOC133347890 isoform X2 [Lethenteron reissneri]|uniref:uncharacterized protein LOC133347890 isoform X2 n=1 Tax=Lethenteron reissneri TaxID=7753 RepID=UPI002AB6FE3E|nr:uncharacterized protein LOC133347890 isoform X2 [Lethenteron reissneri]
MYFSNHRGAGCSDECGRRAVEVHIRVIYDGGDDDDDDDDCPPGSHLALAVIIPPPALRDSPVIPSDLTLTRSARPPLKTDVSWRTSPRPCPSSPRRATRAQQDAADNNVGGKEFWNNFGRKPRARERSGNQCSPTKGDPPQWPPEADEDGGNDWEQQTTQTQRSWGKRREAEGKFLRSSSWDILDSDFGEREGGKKGGTGRDTHPPRIKGGGGGNRGQRQGLVDSKEGKAAEAEDEEGWGEWGWRPIK